MEPETLSCFYAQFVQNLLKTYMLMFESAHFPEMQEALAQNPRELFQMLSSYFHQQMERGQMQSVNPQAVAQAFTSMLFGYAIGLEPINELLSPEISFEEMIEQFVHVFVEGTAVAKI